MAPCVRIITAALRASTPSRSRGVRPGATVSSVSLGGRSRSSVFRMSISNAFSSAMNFFTASQAPPQWRTSRRLPISETVATARTTSAGLSVRTASSADAFGGRSSPATARPACWPVAARVATGAAGPSTAPASPAAGGRSPGSDHQTSAASPVTRIARPAWSFLSDPAALRAPGRSSERARDAFVFFVRRGSLPLISRPRLTRRDARPGPAGRPYRSAADLFSSCLFSR